MIAEVEFKRHIAISAPVAASVTVSVDTVAAEVERLALNIRPQTFGDLIDVLVVFIPPRFVCGNNEEYGNKDGTSADDP